MRAPPCDFVPSRLLLDAQADALKSAERAQVVIHEADTWADLRRVAALCDTVWGEPKVIAIDVLCALARASGTVFIAERVDSGQEVGASVGFLGYDVGLYLHSHIVAVADGWRDVGIGVALKLAQRSFCLSHGIQVIRWTFDPLLQRNAHFNITKLGAVATSFLRDFYGEMTDQINRRDRSDRLEVTWRLDRYGRAGETLKRGAAAPTISLKSGQWGHPEPSTPSVGGWICVPSEYSAWRRQGDPRALEWRLAVRAALDAVFADGYILDAFDQGYYHIGQLTADGCK